MPVIKEPNAEPISGYHLLEPLGKGGFGEVWKCEAPGGLFKAIKFVYGDMNGLEASRLQAEAELRAIQRVKAIRHPFLLSMDRVECIDGELMIVTELADQSLHDVLVQYQRAGRPGIPRRELLGYLREAAEVLDVMNFEHQLQHLDVKPHNLFLVGKHVKVADFGLVKRRVGGRSRHSSVILLGAVTPLYASPEVFLGKISAQSDQYSLAIVYQELLTGKLPFAGKNSRQLLMQHTRGEPNLAPLPVADRPVVTRALAKDAVQRFGSCAEFVQALIDVDRLKRQRRGPHRSSGRREPQRSFAADETARGLAEPSAETEIVAPAVRAGAPVLPGYRFLEHLGATPLADNWRAQAPDGGLRLVKFVYGWARHRSQDQLARFRDLEHGALLPQEIVLEEPGRLVLVSRFVPRTLRERYHECQAQGWPGIPQGELLGYLARVATALDELGRRFAIYHLGLNPRCLCLDDRGVRIADFGLAHLFWQPTQQDLAKGNARYAAPELVGGQPHRHSDQYSLALIYQEMAGSADTPADIADILDRALDPDPECRWPSCLELVTALREARSQESQTSIGAADVPGERLRELLDALQAVAQAPANLDRPAFRADEGELRCGFRAGLALPEARSRLEVFCRQWLGRAIRQDSDQFVFRVSLPSSFWRKWLGRQPGLEVSVRLSRSPSPSATDVRVQIRALRCRSSGAPSVLEDMGMSLVDSLRVHLSGSAEKRLSERLPWPHAVAVSSVAADGSVSPAVECRGKDISLTGVGFYVPQPFPTARIRIHLPTAPATPALAATLVRAQLCPDGGYEVGALFSLGALN